MATLRNNEVGVSEGRADMALDCDCCDATGSVRRSVQTQEFIYGDAADAATLTVEVPVWTCEACGDAYTDDVAAEIRHEAVCRHLNRVPPADLRRFRHKNKLTQEQLSAYSGYGIASVKRWESGAQIPSASASTNLRRLFEPGGLERVRREEGGARLDFEPVFQTVISDRSRRDARRFELRLSPAEDCRV